MLASSNHGNQEEEGLLMSSCGRRKVAGEKFSLISSIAFKRSISYKCQKAYDFVVTVLVMD